MSACWQLQCRHRRRRRHRCEVLWILSSSEQCGFFPLGGSVSSVLFSAQVSSSSSSSSSSASYELKCHRPTSERSNRSESFLDARRGAMRDQALGQKSTGGAAQTGDSGQHLLPRPPTTPRPTTPSSRGASQLATVPWAEEFRLRLDCQRELRMAIWPRLISIRWRNFARSMVLRQMGPQGKLPASWRAASRGAVLRQMVDQRINCGPCPRLVPPKGWPEAPALAGPGARDDYNWDDVWGPAVTGLPGIGNGASSTVGAWLTQPESSSGATSSAAHFATCAEQSAPEAVSRSMAPRTCRIWRSA